MHWSLCLTGTLCCFVMPGLDFGLQFLATTLSLPRAIAITQAMKTPRLILLTTLVLLLHGACYQEVFLESMVLWGHGEISQNWVVNLVREALYFTALTTCGRASSHVDPSLTEKISFSLVTTSTVSQRVQCPPQPVLNSYCRLSWWQKAPGGNLWHSTSPGVWVFFGGRGEDTNPVIVQDL